MDQVFKKLQSGKKYKVCYKSPKVKEERVMHVRNRDKMYLEKFGGERILLGL